MSLGYLYLLTIIGNIAGGCAFVVSIAAGLYYLAELIEEYTVMTKRILRYLTIFVSISHILLVILDGFPPVQTMFSLFSLFWYSLMLRNFPVIELASPVFIGSCLFVLINHFMWFFYFSSHAFGMSQVASFFGLLVWAVPFTYFISLSANEYTLPAFDMSMRQNSSSNLGTSDNLGNLPISKKKGNLIKGIVNNIMDEVRNMMR